MSESRQPPRILILMADQWPRALLRAELLQAGYDATGARSASEGLTLLRADQQRGPLRLVVLDTAVLRSQPASVAEAAGLGSGVRFVLLVPASGQVPQGPWARILRRPITIGEVVAAVQSELPLGEEGAGEIG